MKIWTNGIINPANRGLEGIRDVCDQVPDYVENFGVDEEGPHPLHEEDQTVEVPTTLLHLNEEQNQQVADHIVSQRDDIGIDTYLGTRELVLEMLP